MLFGVCRVIFQHNAIRDVGFRFCGGRLFQCNMRTRRPDHEPLWPKLAGVLHGARACIQNRVQLTVPELAERLGISPGTVYHWLSQGRLPCVRFSSRCVRFRESDVEKMLEELGKEADNSKSIRGVSPSDDDD